MSVLHRDCYTPFLITQSFSHPTFSCQHKNLLSTLAPSHPTPTLLMWMCSQVPFFTTQSSGIFESLYVQIPHTAKIVELLGDFMLPPQTTLPRCWYGPLGPLGHAPGGPGEASQHCKERGRTAGASRRIGINAGQRGVKAPFKRHLWFSRGTTGRAEKKGRGEKKLSAACNLA